MRELLYRIHRARRALDHGQQQRPVRIAGVEITLERVRNQRILAAPVEQRLERHLPHDGYRCVQRVREPYEHPGCARQGAGTGALVLRIPGAAIDEQKRLLYRHIEMARVHDEQLMLPGDAAPRL